MLIKFFKTNSGGGKSGIDYLLNGRVMSQKEMSMLLSRL